MILIVIRLKTKLFVKQMIENSIIIGIFFSLIGKKKVDCLQLESNSFYIQNTIKKLQKHICHLLEIFYLSKSVL